MRFRTSPWEVNAREKFHRYLGIVAAEDDPLDEELEQRLALVRVRDSEERVEVAENMAEPVGVDRFAGNAVDLGLQAAEVVLEQPEVALLHRELGADGLKSGPTFGDGVDQPVHLGASLTNAAEQRRLLAAQWLGPLIVADTGSNDGVVE